jgi:hypothetical protein
MLAGIGRASTAEPAERLRPGRQPCSSAVCSSFVLPRWLEPKRYPESQIGAQLAMHVHPSDQLRAERQGGARNEGVEDRDEERRGGKEEVRVGTREGGNASASASATESMEENSSAESVGEISRPRKVINHGYLSEQPQY